ncbi:MAG: transcriptional regulator [Bacillales bacterium]|jgi:hypothetical protein|nr:transcriptional regulator [Bacillales bacterium]
MAIDWNIIAPILVLQLILVVSALYSLFKQEETSGPKWVWLLIILLISTIGPIIYFIFGRKKY